MRCAGQDGGPPGRRTVNTEPSPSSLLDCAFDDRSSGDRATPRLELNVLHVFVQLGRDPIAGGVTVDRALLAMDGIRSELPRATNPALTAAASCDLGTSAVVRSPFKEWRPKCRQAQPGQSRISVDRNAPLPGQHE
jgi:hypothetical protein